MSLRKHSECIEDVCKASCHRGLSGSGVTSEYEVVPDFDLNIVAFRAFGLLYIVNDGPDLCLDTRHSYELVEFLPDFRLCTWHEYLS